MNTTRARMLLIAFVFAAVLGAQPADEATALGWIKAFNSGNPETMEAFAAVNYSPTLLKARDASARKQIYQEIHASNGQLEVVNVQARNGAIELGVRASKGGQLRFAFTFEGGNISMLRVERGGGGGDDEEPATPLPPLKLPANVTAAQLSSALDPYLKNLERAETFWGVVLVAKGDDVLFEKAYGLASKRFGIPNKTSTRFDVGSITKDFTKIAIMQLAQQQKLALTDTIAKHLPDYPNKEVAAKITIQQLLTHTSGLGDVFTPEYARLNRMRLRKISDYLPIYADDPLLFEPGNGQRYSNYGYIVLGAIVEALSGESYPDYVSRHLFEPAGMKQSGFFESDKIVTDVAVGHTKMVPGGAGGNEMFENTLRLPVRGASDGGSHSTARDLFLFDRSLRKGALLNQEWTGRYYRGDVPATAGTASAGGAPGVNAVISSDGTWSVIVVSNVDPRAAEDLGERVIHAALKGSNAS